MHREEENNDSDFANRLLDFLIRWRSSLINSDATLESRYELLHKNMEDLFHLSLFISIAINFWASLMEDGSEVSENIAEFDEMQFLMMSSLTTPFILYNFFKKSINFLRNLPSAIHDYLDNTGVNTADNLPHLQYDENELDSDNFFSDLILGDSVNTRLDNIHNSALNTSDNEPLNPQNREDRLDNIDFFVNVLFANLIIRNFINPRFDHLPNTDGNISDDESLNKQDYEEILHKLNFPLNLIPTHYICPISQQIISDIPVSDSNTKIVFGEECILRALAIRKQHPITRNFLTETMLVKHYQLAAEIKFFVNRIQSSIQEFLKLDKKDQIIAVNSIIYDFKSSMKYNLSLNTYLNFSQKQNSMNSFFFKRIRGELKQVEQENEQVEIKNSYCVLY